ncbi:MAG: DUF2441 domain-containing protein [Clostridia bacterium]|nr:DUF2441 domain-containing protein [Clostridia bacterium]
MKVKDKIYYQVATDRNYKVGDKLEFGQTLNGVGERVLNTHFQKSGVPINRLGFDYLDNKNIFKNKKLILDMSKALLEADFVLRELAAEEVRKENFPTLPSRFRCMFLSESKVEALANLKKFQKDSSGKHYQAVAVKVSGNIFYAKEVGLQRNGLSYHDNKKVAEQYWAQNQNSSESIKEILFEGKAEVVEILEEVSK